MPAPPFGYLIAVWTAEALEADHRKGIYHWPTSTGAHCPQCLVRLEART